MTQIVRKVLGIAVGILVLPMLASGAATVFMISMDGVRGDYLGRGSLPFFDGMREEAVGSTAVRPGFPSVTFQSHVNIATGAPASVHGITMNAFYDRRTGVLHRHAGDQALLEAEPIWTTATRQGVRTLVLDWVNAHNQTGPHAAAYFGEAYARGMSDEERVERVLRTWEADQAEDPLRLIMAYTESPDVEGHRFGPDAGEIFERMADLDALLARTWERVRAAWQRTADPEDQLYFVVLSDHGMASVHTHIYLDRLVPETAGVVTVVSGALAHFFFEHEDREQAAAAQEMVRARLETLEPVTVYDREALPAHWQYAHPHRTGDLVALLPAGYAFYRHEGPEIMQPAEVTGAHFGTHGYDPNTTSEMHTIFMVTRYPDPLEARDLGPVRTDSIHATIATLLGIEPAPTAHPEPLFVPGKWEAK